MRCCQQHAHHDADGFIGVIHLSAIVVLHQLENDDRPRRFVVVSPTLIGKPDVRQFRSIRNSEFRGATSNNREFFRELLE